MAVSLQASIVVQTAPNSSAPAWEARFHRVAIWAGARIS